jgi:predicted nuclease with TOPRIM domain
MWEDSKRELVDLKQRFNEIIVENVEMTSKLDKTNSEHENLFR